MKQYDKLKFLPECEQVQNWLAKLDKAAKIYEPYYELVEKTRQAYKATQPETSAFALKTGAYNIFWSGIETQKPFIYFKRPDIYVERVNKVATKAEQLACKILERALNWNLGAFDFDSQAKYARNDYLISGCGVLFEAYNPVFQSISLPTGEEIEVIEKEMVLTHYWDPASLLIDTDHTGVWEDVTWIARKMLLTPEQIRAQFGAQKAERIVYPVSSGDEKQVPVFEIWDKSSKAVYWLSPLLTDMFLKVTPDPYHLSGFFPCPKPLFATLTNDTLIPVPDYAMIRRMIDELNGIIERMRLTMQAIKVSGVYDGAFHRLADIFEKDVTLVSLPDFDRLKACGGIRGVIDFIPIEQYVAALEQLARRRDDVVQRIFEITGVSDIMRGNSNANDTATAVVRKTNFGTLRNQDRQNDMQRFITDLYRIKAEIICERYSAQTLASFINAEENYAQEVVMGAIQILKQEKLRGMFLHVESNNVVNHEQQSAQILQGVQTITRLIAAAMPLVSQQPLLLPLYRQMISAVVSSMPRAQTFESVIDQTFSAVSAQLNKKEEPDEAALIEAQRLKEKQDALEAEARYQRRFNRELERLKMVHNYEIEKEKIAVEKEKNRLKEMELRLRMQDMDSRNQLTKREMDMQFVLKKESLKNNALEKMADKTKFNNAQTPRNTTGAPAIKQPAAKAKNQEANIGTGFVKGF